MDAEVVRTASQEVVSRITARRERLGLTQRALADTAGMDQSAVSRIESGQRRVTVDELTRLADALGTSADQLVGRSADGGRLAAAEYLAVHAAGDTALAVRLGRILEVTDSVARVWRMDPQPLLASLEPPLGEDDPTGQGAALARLVREKAGLGDAPAVSLVDLASRLAGVDVAREPFDGTEVGALVQCGTGVDRTLLALVNTSKHPAVQRACLARLMCLAVCRDPEMFSIDPVTGLGDDDVLASTARRAERFASELLVPTGAGTAVASPPVLRATAGEGPDAVSAAAWLTARIAVDYVAPVTYARRAVLESGWLGKGTAEALLALDADAVLAQAELSEEWAALPGSGEVAPPTRVADPALAAYEAGVLGIGTLAALWNTDPRTMHAKASEAGYLPVYESSSFDDGPREP